MTASIHRRVLLWAMGALLAGATLLVGGSWWVLMHEMGEVFEDNLKQVALAVANYHRTDGVARPPRLAQPLPRVYEEYGQFEFVTAVWSRDGRRLHSSNEAVALPFLSRSGLTDVTLAGEHWHLYTIVLDDAIVQAAQRASERASLASETASTLVFPALVFLAVIAALLTYALRRGLAPLSNAASEVTARSVEALHPIPLANHPAELRLLVGAINDLMARLGSALAMQRHFLADAAHELRTPITALRLQLQLLERAGDASQRAAALSELRAGIERAQHLVEQLLQLSRLGPEAPALQRQPVDLAELARSAVGRFSARAHDLGIDLGAATQGPVTVDGDLQQLGALLDNLVENALRYTPRGGEVDVSASSQDGRACLAVRDNGPGIAPSERERVFDRFYRSARATMANGSGLGLAIVKAVAQRHGAEVELGDATGGGLVVTVLFPR
ncbi:MAG: ATP-binding protein [Burkholderiales bacterium]|nr:ATP-binding protein [Burkholderiales bacterium]